VRVVPVDHPADRREALRADVLGQPVEKCAPDSPAAVFLGDERHHASVAEIRLAGEAGADELAVPVREEVETVRLRQQPAAHLLDRGRALPRLHREAHPPPGLQLLVRLGDPELGHPDLLSLPCFFA
jgi:hypothetical protein